MKRSRVFMALAGGLIAWGTAYYGFHETDTLWFTGTKCAQYYAPGRPDHVTAAVEKRVSALAQYYDAHEQNGTVAYLGSGVVHVCGGWRVHCQAREALRELSPNE
jgi:hypothetical protein